MRKLKHLVLCILSGCLFFSTSAYASNSVDVEQRKESGFIGRDSVILPGATAAYNFASVMRGRYIASSGLSISNEGYGVLGVYADTLAHVAVKKIKMTIYIDCWDDVEEDWYQVSYKELSYEYEEGQGDLSSVSEFFEVENLEIGKYYRLRGLHAVWSFDGLMESHSTITNGILLTDGPA